MTKDPEPYESFRNHPPPRRNDHMVLIMFLMVLGTILIAIVIATLIKFDTFSLSSVSAEQNDLTITGIIYDVRPADYGYAFIYFKNGHCLAINDGLSKVLLNQTRTYHFDRVGNMDDLWNLKSVDV